MSHALPRVSIVIPTFNRPDALTRALDRLERQISDMETFEVVVVSDRDEGDPAALERALGGRPYELRHLVRRAHSVSAARNDGWRDTRAALVMFLGDDILASPGLVAEHLARHARQPEREVGVLGRVEWARDLKVTAFMRWLDDGVQFDYRGVDAADAGWGRFYTSNVSLKREMLDLVGGFDEDFEFAYEDLDLAKRMAERGFRLVYAPDATAEHLHHVTVESYARRMAIIGRSERLFCEKHPDFEPYFKPRFEEAAAWPPGQGRLARWADVVPRRLPVLGRLVWNSAHTQFMQRLAPDFLAAWEEAERARARTS